MTITFAKDILPKFRPGDLSCMAPKGVLLGSSEWMCDASGNAQFPEHSDARTVFDALSQGFMPPDQAWPQEWLDTFDSWMADRF